jgi:hypothetical protein
MLEKVKTFRIWLTRKLEAAIKNVTPVRVTNNANNAGSS